MPAFELETMRCEFEGPLARLRLNRPQVLNAANWAFVNDLVAATSELAQPGMSSQPQPHQVGVACSNMIPSGCHMP